MNSRIFLALAAGLCLIPAGYAQSTNDFEAARKLFQNAQWREALVAFDKFETANRFSAAVPDAINYEGWCWFNLQQYEQSAKVFERVLRDYPTAPVAAEATLKKAECYRALRQFDPATQLYREFQAKHPQHALIAQAMLGEAAARFDAKDYAGAKTALRAVRERFPDDLDALFLLGQVLTAEKRYEEADKIYRDLLDRHPNDSIAEQASFSLIQTLAQRGQLEKASAETEAFKKRYPKSVLLENTALIQAEVLFGQQNYTAALPRYEESRAGTKDPQVLETIEFRIALCNFNLGEFAKARDGFAGVVKQYPQGKLAPEALFRLGQTYYEIANHSHDSKMAQPNLIEATKVYEAIRAKYPRAPNLPEVTFRLGYLQSYLAAYDKAIAFFEEFVQSWPKHPLVPEALYQIARNQLAAKRYDNAVTAYRAMLAKFPDHSLTSFAVFEVAGVYAEAKKFPEMVESLREYVKRYPNHARVADALYTIGIQLEAQTKTDDAIAVYRDLIARAAGANPLTDSWRDAAIGAQMRIAALLEPSRAIADCERFLAKFAGHPIAARAVVSQIATLYRKDRKFDAGYAKLDQLALQYRANPAVRVACATGNIDLALAAEDLNRASTATAKLLAESDREKLPAASYIAIGNTFLKTEQFGPAKESFEKLLALYPDDARVTVVGQLGLGQALFGLQQYDAAEALLRKATSADAELTLAEIYEAKGQLTDAVELYNKVLQNARGEISSAAAYRLGNIFFTLTDPVKSKDNKKTALAYYARLLFATGPMAEEATYRTGECHEVLGNRQQTCAAFAAYVKRFPDGQFVNDAKVKLQRLCPTMP